MSDLGVRKIPGIGKVTERLLHEIGIEKCSDFLRLEKLSMLFELFLEKTATSLLQSALGISANRHDLSEAAHERKSISTERTFAELSTSPALEQKCVEICESLATDVKHAQVEGTI